MSVTATQARGRTWGKSHLHCGPAATANQSWTANSEDEWQTDPWKSEASSTIEPEAISQLIREVQLLSYKLSRAEKEIADLRTPNENLLVDRAEALLIDALRRSEEIDAVDFSSQHKIPYPTVAKALERLAARGWISRD